MLRAMDHGRHDGPAGPAAHRPRRDGPRPPAPRRAGPGGGILPAPRAAVAGLLARAAALALLLVPAPAPAQPVEESFGPWRLSCALDRMTDRRACRLLHQSPVERSEPGRPALALEIIDRGGRLVPAVTARDLTLESASRGLLALAGAAQIRFPPHRMFEMPCGLEGRSLVCAPRAEDAARAEQELAGAGSVLLRVVGPGGGSTADPTELPLSATAAAMARLRAQIPPGSQPPEPSAFDPREMLQRLRGFLGGN